MGSRIVVLGGGTGGVVAANVARRGLRDGDRVTVVDRFPDHRFYASYPLVIVGRRQRSAITRPLGGLERKGIEFVRGQVEEIDPRRGSVHTTAGPIGYDHLVIALGAEHHPETVPGMAEGSLNPYDIDDIDRIRQRLGRFASGRIVLFVSSLPYTCPPAPYEIMFLIDDYLRTRGLRRNVDLTLVTPEPYPESLGGPRSSAKITALLGEKGITLRAGARVLGVDPDGRVLRLDHNIDIEADLLMGIPSHWGPAVLRGTDLADRSGWARVHPTVLATRHENVWAIGDCTDLKVPVTGDWHSKAGILAHWQGEVVARNIIAMTGGRKARFRYRAKGG